MNRLCVIDIPGLSLRLLRQAEGLWLNSLASPPAPIRPVFPALPAVMQASMTTGADPGLHGVIAGGLCRRESHRVSLDERSNTLLTQKRFWLAKATGLPKTSLVMWSQPLAGAADLVVGAMCHGPSGVSLRDHPVGLYADVAKAVGPCPTRYFHGPEASWPAAAWTSDAAEWVWRNRKPDLQWICLPGLDFEIARHGASSPQAREAVRVMDLLARRLGETVQQSGGQVVVLSDSAFVDVRAVGLPNLHLRQAGLLTLLETDLGARVDLENSRAFAMVDHQVAHVYCRDAEAVSQAAAALRQDEAIAEVRPREQAFAAGSGQYRAGEWVALARPDAWLHYQWWRSKDEAPRAARRWDVEGKCGYDPCELFAPPFTQAQPGEIDPNPLRVRASRGLVPSDPADWPVLTADRATNSAAGLSATSVPAIVMELMGAGQEALFAAGR